MSPRPRSWSLRARLLAVTVALLAAVTVVIGGVSVLALDRVLMNRLDDQVTAAVDRSARGFTGPGPQAAGPDGGPAAGGRPGRSGPGQRGAGALGVPGQGEGTLGALIEDGAVTGSRVVDRSGDLVTVPAEAAEALLGVARDGRPHTVDLGPGLGSYRVIAAVAPGGTGTLVTGLPLAVVRGPVSQLTGVVAVVGLLGLLAAAVLGALVLRQALQPLRRVAATATRVAEMPLDRGEVALAVRVPAGDTDARTEVGQVGAALNHLLENVASALSARQASETRVRQFVADASHELRTPLAVIRGYAELARRGRDTVPPDIARALARVEAETVRMTGLVEDLLLLARLDAGRPIETSAVDLSALVVDVLTDAQAVGPDHHWSLDLPEVPVVVDGAAARLHQVVANLLANARAHTPPGTHVRVSLALAERDGPWALLRVVDDGPGVPPDLQPAVFERFARGDSSRSRAAGSTGLGLAIVAAVVGAHRGQVQLESRPGRTSFTVRLPPPGQRSDV